MVKMSIIILFFIFSNINSLSDISKDVIELKDLTKTKFILDNEFVLLKYENNMEKLFNSSINFIFDNGEKSSTKIYIYDSLDKIQRGETGFINYLHETSLKGRKYFTISYDDSFYKDKTTYYFVLYDISTKYTDYIYVLNSLNYLPLEEEIYYQITFDIQLKFNFIVEKNYLTYLHYQARDITGLIYKTAYKFKIINENGETFINEENRGTCGYVEIKPNIKYFIEVELAQSSSGSKETEFMLNFKKNKEKFLLEEGKEKEVRVLHPQSFSFFRTISNLTINETIRFKGKIDKSDFHYDRFYVKYYESDNFENLVNDLPSNRQDFDYEIGSLSWGGEFDFKLKKKKNSKKGILLGVFIDSNELYFKLEPTKINIITLTGEEEEKKEEEKEQEQEDNSDSSSLSAGAIFGIILSCIIFIAIIICCCKYTDCCDSSGSKGFCIIFFTSEEYYSIN